MWSVWLVFCDCGFHSVCPLMDRIRGLHGRDWLWGNLDLVLRGGTMLSKPLMQFSVDGRVYVPPLLFGLRPNYSRGKGNGDLLQKDLCPQHCYIQCPWPCSRPLSTHVFTRDSWTFTGKYGSVSCGYTTPFSWVLVHTRFCLFHPIICFPSQWHYSDRVYFFGLQNYCRWWLLQ